MRNLYTIIKGLVIAKKETCEIPFALVFFENGIYYIETFLNDPTFFERHKNSQEFFLTGKTEKGYDIECSGLYWSNYHYNNQKVTFICEDYIRLINNKNKDQIKNELNPIYLIEIEGMKMQFSDHTEIKKFRNAGEVDEILNFEFDHTTSTFILNHPNIVGNCYNILFFKNPENENILIDFDNKGGNCRLYYENYLMFKKELISFLSFINGAQIYVRKEFTGTFLTIKGLHRKYDAQIIYLYSFAKKIERHYNNYLPINYHHSDTHKIFSGMFIFGFDKYYQLNKILDFNSLVFSLNSTSAFGLDERYYILITALERISRNYSKSLPQKSDNLINKGLFENKIKPKLNEVIEKFKNDIINENRSAWNIFSSKIGNLNKRNITETTQKLYYFLNYAKIKINSNVTNLVENERDAAVHEGIIGSNDQERILNYLKLDHILRDIILNLIEYKGPRKREFDYEKEIVKEK
jgi:hypothetical protein